MINDKFGEKKRIKFIFSRKSARLETNSFTHNLLTGLYATHCNQNGTKDSLEPCSWNILSVDFESFCILKHTAKCGRFTFFPKNHRKPTSTWNMHARTHTHLTIRHTASNGQLQCFLHPSTPTDGRCSTQTQPSPLTNAYSAMETDDVNRNNCNLPCVSPSVGVNVCFIHAWFKQ